MIPDDSDVLANFNDLQRFPPNVCTCTCVSCRTLLFHTLNSRGGSEELSGVGHRDSSSYQSLEGEGLG